MTYTLLMDYRDINQIVLGTQYTPLTVSKPDGYLVLAGFIFPLFVAIIQMHRYSGRTISNK